MKEKGGISHKLKLAGLGVAAVGITSFIACGHENKPDSLAVSTPYLQQQSDITPTVIAIPTLKPQNNFLEHETEQNIVFVGHGEDITFSMKVPVGFIASVYTNIWFFSGTNDTFIIREYPETKENDTQDNTTESFATSRIETLLKDESISEITFTTSNEISGYESWKIKYTRDSYLEEVTEYVFQVDSGIVLIELAHHADKGEEGIPVLNEMLDSLRIIRPSNNPSNPGKLIAL